MNNLIRKCGVSGVAVALSLAILAPAAPAQQSRHFNLAGGVSVPSGNFPADSETGYHLLVGIGIGEGTRSITFRVDGMANRFRGGRVVVGSDRRFADHSIYALIGNAVYTLPGARVQPYVIGGAGYYVQNGGAANQNLGLSAGLGLRSRLGGVNAFLESRYHNFLALDLSGDTRDPARLVPISVGVTF